MALMEDFFLSKNDNGQSVVTVREGAESLLHILTKMIIDDS